MKSRLLKPRRWPDNKRSFLGCNVAEARAVVAGRQSALLAYRVGPDVRNLLLVAGTVDTHPLCNAERKAAASDAFDAPAKIAFLSVFMTPRQ